MISSINLEDKITNFKSDKMNNEIERWISLVMIRPYPDIWDHVTGIFKSCLLYFVYRNGNILLLLCKK